MTATTSGRRWPFALVLILGAAAACGRDAPTAPVADATDALLLPGVGTLAAAGGNLQTAAVGTRLPEALSVRLTDAGGRPVAGRAVSWAVTVGGGTLTGAEPATDANGYARATWTLGAAAGGQAVRVTAGGRGGLVLRAYATDGTAHTAPLGVYSLSAAGGDAQASAPGQALPQPLRVRAVDRGGRPVAGVTVRFQVAAGGGRLAADSAVTGVDGLASTSWTLGMAMGTQAVSAVGANAQKVAFNATAISVQLLATSGDGQTGVTGRPLEERVVVRVVNAAGVGVPGIAVRWSVTTGGGSIAPALITTDANGDAPATWTLGPNVGAQTATASVEGLVSLRFFAAAVAPQEPPVRLKKILGDSQVVCPGCGLREAMYVRAVDPYGNPVPGTPLTWTVSSGTGVITHSQNVTDATGTAFGGFTTGPVEGEQTVTITAPGGASTTFVAFASLGGKVATIQMNPGFTWIDVGDSTHVYATALDTRSRNVPGAVLVWSTDRPDVISFTVTPQGGSYGRAKIHGLAPGEARLTATADGKSNTIVLRVFAPGTRPGGGGGGGSASIRPDGS